MILLTGANGFIGKHLLNKLASSMGGDRIVALTSKPIDGVKSVLHNDYSFDPKTIEHELQKIDTILHVGAFTPKNSIESNDLVKCNSNINNTWKLLSLQLPRLKKIIFLSSLDVYARQDTITETGLVVPVSLYGDSKLYCEKMITAYAKAKGVDTIILRVGHVYGPGEEKYGKLIPTVIKQIKNNDSIKVFGTGEETRAFINIEDVVEFILLTLDLKLNFELINVVSDEHIRVRELIEMLFSIMGKSVPIVFEKSSIPTQSLYFNNSKLRTYFSPRISLGDGLREEVDYLIGL